MTATAPRSLPRLLLVHPDFGVPADIETLPDGGALCSFDGESGESLRLIHRAGQWTPAPSAPPVAIDPPPAPSHGDAAHARGERRARRRREEHAEPEPGPLDALAETNPALAALVLKASKPPKGAASRVRSLVALFDDSSGEIVADRGRVFAVALDGSRRLALDRDELREWLARAAVARGLDFTESLIKEAAFVLISRKARDARVFYRVAAPVGESRVLVDLGDDTGAADEIDPDGWRVVDAPDVLFRRHRSMKPLPRPVAGGSLDELRELLGLDAPSFATVVICLVCALAPCGPYALLFVIGEPGSGKSTLIRTMRALTDPQTAALRPLPKDDRELAIAAERSHVLAFDNVSRLPPGTADALCRLATGAGFATRELYTDRGEVTFDECRPVLINGIADLLSRGDLASRALVVNLAPRDYFIAERDLDARLAEARPRILGALYSAVSCALRNLATTPTPRGLRLADAARFAVAAEPALPFPPGTVAALLRTNRDVADASLLDTSPLARFVRLWASTNRRATAGELFSELPEAPANRARESWPATASELSAELRRLAPALRREGVHVRAERTARARLWSFSLDSDGGA